MHSQIYSGLSWIFAILRNFRVAGANESIRARWANILFFHPIGQKKVTLGPLFRSENDENRACVSKKIFSTQKEYLHFKRFQRSMYNMPVRMYVKCNQITRLSQPDYLSEISMDPNGLWGIYSSNYNWLFSTEPNRLTNKKTLEQIKIWKNRFLTIRWTKLNLSQKHQMDLLKLIKRRLFYIFFFGEQYLTM